MSLRNYVRILLQKFGQYVEFRGQTDMDTLSFYVHNQHIDAAALKRYQKDLDADIRTLDTLSRQLRECHAQATRQLLKLDKQRSM